MKLFRSKRSIEKNTETSRTLGMLHPWRNLLAAGAAVVLGRILTNVIPAGKGRKKLTAENRHRKPIRKISRKTA